MNVPKKGKPEKDKNFNDTLKRMLNTPPQPHQKNKSKKKK
jgi:hypothetical protein